MSSLASASRASLATSTPLTSPQQAIAARARTQPAAAGRAAAPLTLVRGVHSHIEGQQQSAQRPSAPKASRVRHEVIVRQATEEDAQALIAFEQALAQETEGKSLDDDNIRRGILVPLRCPHLARAYVAVLKEDPSKYAGFITIGTQWSEWYGGFMHWVMSTYVGAEYRGSAVFSQIYRHIQASVKEDRLSVGMRLYVEKENIRAQKTYEKLGMHIEDYAMFKWMKDDSHLPAKQRSDIPFPDGGVVEPKAFPAHHPWSIRLAAAADLPALVQLQLDNAKEQRSVDLKLEDVRRGVAMPWAEPNLARMYVAEENGKIIGVLMVTNEWSEWRGGIVYWLTSIYVTPEHRGRGVLKSLYDFAKKEVEAEPNAVGFRMQALSSSETGRRLAAKLGLVEEPYYLMRWMDPHGALVSRMAPIDGSSSVSNGSTNTGSAAPRSKL